MPSHEKKESSSLSLAAKSGIGVSVLLGLAGASVSGYVNKLSQAFFGEGVWGMCM